MSDTQTSNQHVTNLTAIADYMQDSTGTLKMPDIPNFAQATRDGAAEIERLEQCLFQMQEAAKSLAAETTPQAPIAHVTVREYEGGYRYGWGMYAPGLPPGTHDLYCEPPAPGGQKVPHPCFEREPPHCSTCACGMPAPETDEGRQRLIDEARILFPHCGDPPNETKADRTYVAVVEPHHDRMKIGGRVVMIERIYEALGMDLPVCPHGVPYVENTCGPCSQGRLNRLLEKTKAEPPWPGMAEAFERLYGRSLLSDDDFAAGFASGWKTAMRAPGTVCRQCRERVSTGANYCPGCGIHDPLRPAPDVKVGQ